MGKSSFTTHKILFGAKLKFQSKAKPRPLPPLIQVTGFHKPIRKLIFSQKRDIIQYFKRLKAGFFQRSGTKNVFLFIEIAWVPQNSLMECARVIHKRNFIH
jgi:hypothetical protein